MARTKEKVTVSIDAGVVARIDEWVAKGEFESRSAAVDAALVELQRQHAEKRYEDALALLDPVEEQAMAEEGMADYSRLVLGSTEWPEEGLDRAV